VSCWLQWVFEGVSSMIAAIIQARMGSTRLPGKVMRNISGKPLIEHIVERLGYSKILSDIVLATTMSSEDDILVKWANSQGVKCFRGSEENVLERFYLAAKKVGADIVVRVTADDPFKDPVIIDQALKLLHDAQLDFVSNNNPPSFPEGLDVEVFTFSALKVAQSKSIDPFEREHVTPYFYRNPTVFLQKNIECSKKYHEYRWTIDVQADFEMAVEVYNALYNEEKIFLMKDILSFLKKNPLVSKINMNEKRSALYEK
jgi:spore coat polysaccharide biosynthesis protein SpsF